MITDFLSFVIISVVGKCLPVRAAQATRLNQPYQQKLLLIASNTVLEPLVVGLELPLGHATKVARVLARTKNVFILFVVVYVCSLEASTCFATSVTFLK